MRLKYKRMYMNSEVQTTALNTNKKADRNYSISFFVCKVWCYFSVGERTRFFILYNKPL